MTTIREFLTKMIQADASATEMLDANLKRRNVMIIKSSQDGITRLAQVGEQGAQLLTANSISELMKEDANQAINIMSQLVKRGALDMETLIKVFNGRYGLIVNNMLRQLDGSIEEYSKRVNESTNLDADYNKQMDNLNNQWKVFKNNMFGAQSATISTTKAILDLVGWVGNGAFKLANMNEVTKASVEILSMFSTTALGLTGALAVVDLLRVGFIKLSTSLQALNVSLSPLVLMGWIAVASVVVTVAVKVWDAFNKAKIKNLEYTEALKKNKSAIEDLDIKIRAHKDNINSINFTSAINSYSTIDGVMRNLATTADVTYDSVKALNDLINTPLKAPEYDLEANRKSAESLDRAMAKNDLEIKSLKDKISKKDKISSIGYDYSSQSSPEMIKWKSDLAKLEKRNKELKLLKSDMDRKYKEENEKYLAQQEIRGSDVYSETGTAIEKMKTSEFKGLLDVMKNLKIKNKDNFFLELAKLLPKSIDNINEFKNTVQSVEKIKGVGSFTGLDLADESVLDAIVTLQNFNDAKYNKKTGYYAQIEKAEKELYTTKSEYRKKELKDQIAVNKEAIKSTDIRIEQQVKLLKHSSGTLEVKKEKNLVDYEAVLLADNYSEALAKQMELGKTDLELLVMRRQELTKTYNTKGLLGKDSRSLYKQFENSFGKMSDTSISGMKKRHDELAGILASFSSGEISEEEKKRRDLLKDEYDAYDSILKMEIEYSTELKKNTMDIESNIKAQKLQLESLKESYPGLVEYELKRLELNNKLIVSGDTEEARFKRELELIMKRYLFEQESLIKKERALKTQLQLEKSIAEAINKGEYDEAYSSIESTAYSKLTLPKYANGGMTGSGFTKDSSGQKVAGIVHDFEYIIPKWMVKSNPQMIAMLEAMRTGKKGYADGGFSGSYSEFLKSDEISKVDPNLIKWLNSFVSNYSEKMKSQGITLSITDAIRNIQEQQKYVGRGSSKTLNSKHLTGNALDLLFSKNGKADWTDSTKWLEMAYKDFKSYMSKHGINATWGGNWDKNDKTKDKFVDKFHFQTDDPYNKNIQNLLKSSELNITTTKGFLSNKKWDTEESPAYTKAKIGEVSKYLLKQGFSKVDGQDDVYENANQWVKIYEDVSKGLTKLTEGSGKYNLKTTEETKSTEKSNIETKSVENSKTETKELKDYSKILQQITELKQLGYDKDIKDLELVIAMSESGKLSLDNINNLTKSTDDYNLKLKALQSYKDRMYNSDDENSKYSIQSMKNEYDNLLEQINKMDYALEDTYKTMDETTNKLMAEETDDAKKTQLKNANELAKTRLKELSDKEKAKLLDEEKIKGQEIINAELDYEYKKRLSIINTMMSALESIVSGKGMSFDISQVREGAMKSFDKKSEGGTFNGSDWSNTIGYGIGLIDSFMKTGQEAQSKALSYEMQVLDMRIQGAKTEEEKAELEKQQLELQKQQIDLQYQQSTSFMGTTGVAGGAMSGAFSSLASKNLTKLTSGDWIGAGIGMVSGILGAKSAKKDAERQKKMLEYQYKMTQYLEEMNKNIEANNTLLSMTVSEGSKVGVYRATQSAIQSVVNSSDATLGGSATSAWNDRYWHGGFNRGWEDNWITTMANYDVTDFGMTESDLTNQQNILTLLAKVKEEQTKYAQYATTYNQTEGVESQAHSNYLALQEFIDALNDLYSLQVSMSPKIYKQYLGATLEAVEDSSGKITDYTVSWTDFIAEQFSSIYSSIASNIKASGNAITSSLFSGLNNMFIQNYSKVGSILDEITAEYESLAQTLSSNTSAMDMTAINSTFVDLIAYVEQYKAEQEAVNEVSDEFITMWIANGGELSDVVDSMSAGMSSIYDSMKSALTSNNVTQLGTDIATELVDSISEELMSGKLTSTFQNLYASFSQAMADSTLSNLSSLYTDLTSAQVAMEAEQLKLASIKDLFSTDVSYSDISSQTNYTMGSSKSITNNYSISTNVDGGYIFTENEQSLFDFGNLISTYVKNALTDYRS